MNDHIAPDLATFDHSRHMDEKKKTPTAPGPSANKPQPPRSSTAPPSPP